jgi:hypothetical protein
MPVFLLLDPKKKHWQAQIFEVLRHLGRGMGSQLIGGSLLFLLEKVAVEYKVC